MGERQPYRSGQTHPAFEASRQKSQGGLRKKRGDRKLAGRVGEGKKALCPDCQGTRGCSEESGEAGAPGFERRTGGGRRQEHPPQPQLSPTAPFLPEVLSPRGF